VYNGPRKSLNRLKQDYNVSDEEFNEFDSNYTGEKISDFTQTIHGLTGVKLKNAYAIKNCAGSNEPSDYFNTDGTVIDGKERCVSHTGQNLLYWKKYDKSNPEYTDHYGPMVQNGVTYDNPDWINQKRPITQSC
jgi:hypothetical protein